MDINKLLEDAKFVNYVVDRFIPFKLIYKMVDMDYKDMGNNMCIFHDNTNTPSAKVYHNDNGDSLYCYSEQRSYKPSSAFRKGIINHRIESIAYNILKQFSDEQIKSLIDDYGQGLETFEMFSDDELTLLGKFKAKEMNVDEFNKTLINILYFGR